MTNQVSEPFHLTSGDPGNTEADGTVNTWSDIWKYQVPRGTTIILDNGNTFFAYLEDTSPAEIGDLDSEVRIVVKDPSGGSERYIYGPNLYKTSKEQQDDDLIARLMLPDTVRVPARWFIHIQAKDGVAIDASDSYYDLFCHRERPRIGNNA